MCADLNVGVKAWSARARGNILVRFCVWSMFCWYKDGLAIEFLGGNSLPRSKKHEYEIEPHFTSLRQLFPQFTITASYGRGGSIR